MKSFVALSLVVASALVASALSANEPAPFRKPVASTLTMEKVKTILENMGLDNVKEGRNDANELMWVQIDTPLAINGGTWTFHPFFTLSPDRTNLWIGINITEIKNPEALTVKKVLKLLNAGNQYWPAYFSFDETRNLFRLHLPVPAQDVNARVLRQRIDLMLNVLRETHPEWNPEL